jgi:hypothetical protein
MTSKFLFALPLLFIKLAFIPNASLIAWLFIVLALDFLTGVAKAAIRKDMKVTSTGYRRTLSKIIQYVGSIALVVILGNASKQNELVAVEQILRVVGDGITVLIIFIEVVSVLENLVAIDNKSMIAKYVFNPLHKLLTLQIKNNTLAKSQEDEKPTAQN